jgi:hypothetical protein
MPKIQRANIPPAVMAHLLDRVIAREITPANLHQMQKWIETNPTVPDGDWYKRFGTFSICGKGPLVKTFLTSKQVPVGTEVL